mmetsp:Transcript_48430/g.109116  ORF Transcript_48430/g.109116 Transcript_48430/m.109116 type:complete len:94 (+) Transcript_48430:418-699(+)
MGAPRASGLDALVEELVARRRTSRDLQPTCIGPAVQVAAATGAGMLEDTGDLAQVVGGLDGPPSEMGRRRWQWRCAEAGWWVASWLRAAAQQR